MFRMVNLLRAGFVIAASVSAAVTMNAEPANAVVYCKTVGVPKGCVARPVARPVVYCKTRGVPKGCVMR